MPDWRRVVDQLLETQLRDRQALAVLHAEADTDLPYDLWVELQAARHDPALRALMDSQVMED
jgi:hypothetical protein